MGIVLRLCAKEESPQMTFQKPENEELEILNLGKVFYLILFGKPVGEPLHFGDQKSYGWLEYKVELTRMI